MDMKRFFLYAIVIAALALAGCGSDGNGGMVDNGMPDPTPPPMCPEGQVGTYPNCAPPGPTPEEIAAATKAADTKRTQIEAEGSQETEAGLGGRTSDGSAVDTYEMTIERGASSATKVTITDSAMMGDDDPKFMQAMDLGGGLTMHTRTMEADDDGNVVEEVVMVKTDIDAAKPTAFAMVDGQELTVRADGKGVNTTNKADSLTINADNLAHVSATAFASSTGAGTINFNGDTEDTEENEAAMVSGTFNGAMGTYVCTTAAGCSVTLTDDKVTAINDGTWVFTPAAGATSPVADSDYLHYGFWLKRTTDDDGVLTYNEVETFAGSSLGDATVASVTGTAKYDGDAVGVYVMDTYKSDGKVDASTSGHFTADVNLTATFGQVTEGGEGTIAQNLLNSITGTISGFDLSGGEDASGWEVDVAGDIANNGVADGGTARGSGKDGPAGSFTGMFQGDDMNDENAAIAPKALVGEFNADFSNGAVAGAYGARKVPPMMQ